MDFTLSDDQQQLQELASRVFADWATPDRLDEVEAATTRFDTELWAVLAETGLLGVALPEAAGGSGGGLVELCVLLEQQGRRLPSVPLWATLAAGAWPLARFGTAGQRSRWLPGVVGGDCLLAGAFDPIGVQTVAEPVGDGLRLSGRLSSVPAADLADGLLVPIRRPDGTTAVAILETDRPGLEIEPVVTTNRQAAGHVILRSVPVAEADLLGGPEGRPSVDDVLQPAVVGLSAVSVGITEEAVRMAAAYTAERQQFGRPVATFQGVALKAADAYIDTEAMRVTMWQAAWRLDAGLPARAEVAVAKWWAAHGCHRAVHSALHLHGGIGNDVTYPLHRYFLWGTQVESTLGGTGQQRALLGDLIAAGGLG